MVLQLSQPEPTEPHPICVVIAVASEDAPGREEGGREEGVFFGFVTRKNRVFLPRSHLCSPAHPFDHHAHPFDKNELYTLVFELKRITLNAPIFLVPLPELSSLRAEPSLLCIVAHTTIFDATLRSLPLPPYALLEYCGGELRLTDVVLLRTQKRRRR